MQKSKILKLLKFYNKPKNKMNSPKKVTNKDKNKLNDNIRKSRTIISAKNTTTELSSSPPKNYLPSRLNVNEILTHTVQYSKSSLLNQLESNMVTLDNDFSKLDSDKLNNRIKEMQRYHPSQKSLKAIEFKQKPIKRAEMDFQIYKEIFVQPKEKMLSELKAKEKTFEELFYKGASKQYDKILNPSEENKHKPIAEKLSPDFSSRLAFNDIPATSINSTDVKVFNQHNGYISVDNSNPELTPNLAQNKIIETDTKIITNPKDKTQNERTFFDQQIQVDNYFKLHIML